MPAVQPPRGDRATNPTTREHIVDAADGLFYRQGYEHTSFADIAGVVKISRGNCYHHFQTKDQILGAVIDRRIADTERMLAEWERAADDPTERIRGFVRILVAHRADIMRYGCPVGTLCTELAKLDHAARADANGLLALFRTWLGRQFRLLGRDADADELAMHVLAWSQGVATLAQAFHDEAFVEREVAQLCTWLARCTHTTSTREYA
jgi:TetR/AcrR family transcriptional regulator, transcriptional repressor for nem operon